LSVLSPPPPPPLLQAEELRARLDDHTRRVRSAEATLDHVEGERDAAEGRMGQLSGALEAVTTRAAECELEAEGLRERVAGLTDELVSVIVQRGLLHERCCWSVELVRRL
jgi:chromosome segregation ATPase